MARKRQLTKEQLRKRAKTDLQFLASVILGYDIYKDVHGPMCDFFVQKDDTKPIHLQDDLKQRLLLYPRGHYKTTLDIVDAIQWIINFPDIRILLMSGTRELVTRKLSEVKHHFLHNPVFRSLFPEFCPNGPDDFGTQEEFTVPCRQKKHLREPTVSISTIDSVKAGSHYDVIKCDDLVHENNIGTKEQIAKAIQSFHYTTPLLDPGGYRDVIGTRYDFSDLYGSIIEANTPGWKILSRACWKRDGDKLILLFPQRETRDGRLLGFTEDMLRQIQQENAYLFNCQFLNDPTPTEASLFTPGMIVSHTIPFEKIPVDVSVFIAWDTASTVGKQSNYSVGAVGGYDIKGNLYVIALLRGRFLPDQLEDMIIGSNIRWKPIRLGVEDAAGAKMMESSLRRKAMQGRCYLPLDWIKTGPKDGKPGRISALQALLKSDNLWFSQSIEDYEQMVKEFTRFPNYMFDDIPDAISRLLQYKTLADSEPITSMQPYEQFVQYPDSPLGVGLVG